MDLLRHLLVGMSLGIIFVVTPLYLIRNASKKHANEVLAGLTLRFGELLGAPGDHIEVDWWRLLQDFRSRHYDDKNVMLGIDIALQYATFSEKERIRWHMRAKLRLESDEPLAFNVLHALVVGPDPILEVTDAFWAKEYEWSLAEKAEEVLEDPYEFEAALTLYKEVAGVKGFGVQGFKSMLIRYRLRDHWNEIVIVNELDYDLLVLDDLSEDNIVDLIDEAEFGDTTSQRILQVLAERDSKVLSDLLMNDLLDVVTGCPEHLVEETA